MKIHFLIYITFLFIVESSELVAQDFVLTQYETMPQYLNPSMIGDMEGKARISAVYGNQWSSILKSASYQTRLIAFDSKKKVSDKNSIGYGLGVISESAGSSSFNLNRINLSLSYGMNLSTKENIISLISIGSDLGLTHRSIESTPPPEWVPIPEPVIDSPVLHPDIGAGIQWRFEKLSKFKIQLGGSLFHLNKPNVSFNPDSIVELPLRSVLHASTEVSVSSKIAILGHVEFHTQREAKNNIIRLSGKYTLNDENKLKWLQLGAWVRSGDSGDEFHTKGTGALVHFSKISVGFSIEKHEILMSNGYQFHLGYTFNKEASVDL